jgi:hypothetical protein
MSYGVDKKIEHLFYLNPQVENSKAYKVGAPLPRRIFKRSKNGAVLLNEGKHIRKVLFLRKITVRLFRIKVMQYRYIHNFIIPYLHTQSIYISHTYPGSSTEKSINPVCLNGLNFPTAKGAKVC